MVTKINENLISYKTKKLILSMDREYLERKVQSFNLDLELHNTRLTRMIRKVTSITKNRDEYLKRLNELNGKSNTL